MVRIILIRHGETNYATEKPTGIYRDATRGRKTPA